MRNFLIKLKCFCSKQKKRISMVLIVLFGVLLDQLSKILVVSNLDYIMENEPIVLIKHLINLTYTENRGAAFGMLDDHRWIFMTVSIIAIIGMAVYLFGFSKEGWTFQIGLSLIISGGIGNMIDRLALGYVVDMLEFDFMEFAIFNVADSFVCIGAGLVILMLIIELIRESKKNSKNQDATEIYVELDTDDNN
ncbi:MAG: signal peptidase II [Clostridia bacterium]|nr:signal peptidase II [Clostridia bacterium]